MCELGAGLGLVSILLDKLAVCSELVVTDGDEDTLQLLVENKIDNEASFDTSYLLWGEHEDFLSEHPDLFDTLIALALHLKADKGKIVENRIVNFKILCRAIYNHNPQHTSFKSL